MNIQKCAVIGCGDVGATIAFTLIKSGLISEMVLLDINQSKAEGEAMDMNHALPYTKPVQIYAGSYEDLTDCGIIVITAGANQSPNETRLDLIQKNTKIMESIIPQVTKYNQDGILLIVSNPVDIMTYVALKMSGFPKERVIGSGTVLDTARLKYLVGKRLIIDSRNVHAFVIGEHGDSELPVWSSANVSGIDIGTFLQNHQLDQSIMDEIDEDVKKSAYRIIEKKGSTYYGIAVAVLRIMEAIVRDEHSVLPVSSFVSNQYGIQNLCIGLPSIVGRTGVKEIIDIPLNATEQQQLQKSADTLLDAIAKIGYAK